MITVMNQPRSEGHSDHVFRYTEFDLQIIVFIQLVATTALPETQNCGSTAKTISDDAAMEFTQRTLCLGHATGSDGHQSGGNCGTPYNSRQ